MKLAENQIQIPQPCIALEEKEKHYYSTSYFSRVTSNLKIKKEAGRLILLKNSIKNYILLKNIHSSKYLEIHCTLLKAHETFLKDKV